QGNPFPNVGVSDPSSEKIYQVLGIAENTQREDLITAAYQAALQKHHDDPQAVEKIERAMRIVSDPVARAAYDRLRKIGRTNSRFDSDPDALSATARLGLPFANIAQQYVDLAYDVALVEYAGNWEA